MGLSASSDSFCRRSDRVFQGLPVVKLVDDLLVKGRSKNDAVKKLGKVLKACRKNGVVISPKKMESRNNGEILRLSTGGEERQTINLG